jgi:CRISPR/Cas system-associated endonuclease Cas1
MEELRPVRPDRLALSLLNPGQLATDDFTIEDAAGVLVIDKATNG